MIWAAAVVLWYVIDVLVQPVDGDPGALGDHGLGNLRRCGQPQHDRTASACLGGVDRGGGLWCQSVAC